MVYKRLILLLCILCCVACKSHKGVVYGRVDVPVYIHDTVRLAVRHLDSIHVDRWRTVYIAGDTVRQLDSVAVVEFRSIIDTFVKIVEKPVKIVEKQVVENKKKNTFVDKLLKIIILVGFAVVLVSICRRNLQKKD